MEENKEDQPQAPTGKEPEGFIDERTKNKIDRHLHHADDTISAEDIKNVSTDVSSNAIPGRGKPLPAEEDKDDHKEEMPTSWDILG